MPVEGRRAKLAAWLSRLTCPLQNRSRRRATPGSRGAPWVPWVLIVLATIIALVSALNLWVKRQALSTDNWTNASSQLLENPEIRNAISVYLVNQLYDNVDVGQALEERLPPATKPLAPTIAGALEPALVQLANNVLARPRLQQLWVEANRRAHQLLIALLDGKHELLVSTNGNVVLDLRPLLEQFVEQTGLGERVLAKLPPDAGQLVVLQGNQLESARKTVKVIRVLSFLLTFLVLALFALAIYLARGRRRRMLLAAGFWRADRRTDRAGRSSPRRAATSSTH